MCVYNRYMPHEKYPWAEALDLVCRAMAKTHDVNDITLTEYWSFGCWLAWLGLGSDVRLASSSRNHVHGCNYPTQLVWFGANFRASLYI